jgi:hypothetical protein
VEVEGFGGAGVIAAAFGDVRVAGGTDRVDDRVAQGGEVDRAVAGAVGGVVFGEGDVADVVDRLDGPVFARESGEVGGAGFGAGEAGDGVEDLAGDRAGLVVLPPSGDLDCLSGVGQGGDGAVLSVRVSVRPWPRSRLVVSVGT